MDIRSMARELTTTQASRATLLAGLQGTRPRAPLFMRCDSSRPVYADRRWEWAFSSLDSCSLWSMQDEDRELLDGARSYRLTLPAGVPVERSFAIAACDGRTWPLVRMELKFAVGDGTPGCDPVTDGIEVCFGPKRPAGRGVRWIRTTPGIGWFALLRFVNPRESFLDKSWKPGDLVAE
jgi:hypothetical protein